MDNKSPDRRYLLSSGRPKKGCYTYYQVAQKVNNQGRYLANHHKMDEKECHEMIEFMLEEKVSIPAIGLQSHMHAKDGVLSEKNCGYN